jgi:hypothetical protein
VCNASTEGVGHRVSDDYVNHLTDQARVTRKVHYAIVFRPATQFGGIACGGTFD